MEHTKRWRVIPEGHFRSNRKASHTYITGRVEKVAYAHGTSTLSDRRMVGFYSEADEHKGNICTHLFIGTTFIHINNYKEQLSYDATGIRRLKQVVNRLTNKQDARKIRSAHNKLVSHMYRYFRYCTAEELIRGEDNADQ